MRKRAWAIAAVAILSGESLVSAADHPAFCTGIAVGPSGNKMFFSRVFSLTQATPPPAGMLAEPNPATTFAAEVKRRSGDVLIGASCPTRATPAEVEELLGGSKASNSANWTIVDIDWAPGAAAPPSTRTAEPARDNAAEPRQPPPAAPAAAPAVDRAAEAAAARRAELEAAEAEKLRALNGSQAQAAEAQRRKIEADMAAQAAAQRDYQAKLKAYADAKLRHDAAVQAAAAAKAKWEADVAACTAGDHSRCAPVSQ
jgi:hypothetical protein